MELNPTSTAIVTIHCQGDIVGPQGAFAPLFHEQVVARGVVDKIGSLHSAARQAGALLIYTRVAWADDYSDLQANSPLLQGVVQTGCLKEGSPSAEIIAELAPRRDDVVLTHKRVGGFTEDMGALLRERGVDTLLFCGVATNVSVEGTARAAGDAGYRVIVIEDACSAASLEAHQASIATMGMLGFISTVDEARLAFTGANDVSART